MKFDRLNNTRDLGGLTGADGRKVLMNKLIRSGRLSPGSEEDIKKIGNLVSAVVDFRSENERLEAPDPSIDGVSYYHIPIIGDLAAGVSRDQKSDKEAFMMLVNDPDGALKYMCRMYMGFASSKAALAGYRSFVNLLLENERKATLWHCTAGKDRAGFASVIVLEILGADRDTIMENYLMTNTLIKSDVDKIVNMFFNMIGSGDEKTEQSLRNMFEARSEYLEAAYAGVEELYGDFKTFLAEGLRLTESDIQKMRDKYLERSSS